MNKNNKVVVTAVCAIVATVAILMLLIFIPKDETAAETEPLYASRLFCTDVMTIDIIADETAWQTMLDNAMDEEYISVDVIINGQKITNVGIRPKGNNSLQQVASSDSDRYGFKIKIDEYVKGQTCFGLDMLVLNNMIGDATCMKEYTAFDMMKTMGIETPYFNYADISLNGEKWGFYFAMEAYNDSYEQRVNAEESGVLYNVKTMGSMGGNNDMPQMDFPESYESLRKDFSDHAEKSRSDKGFGRGSMGAGSTGVGATGTGSATGAAGVVD